MANVYVDMTLASGANDGTSWSDAYQAVTGFESAATASSAGDFIYVKNTVVADSGDDFLTFPNDAGNPVIVLGCQTGTTNEPPVTADLVSGFMTGGASPATDSTLPGIAAGSHDIYITGSVSFYAISLKAGDNVYLADSTAYNDTVKQKYYESEFEWGAGSGGVKQIQIGKGGSLGDVPDIVFQDCIFEPISVSDYGFHFLRARVLVLGGSFSADTARLLVIDGIRGGGSFEFVGVDLSNCTTLVYLPGVSVSHACRFDRCKLHASAALTTGTKANDFKLEFVNCTSASGFSSDQSIQTYDLISGRGDITMETTAVRTNGANDGASGGFSWAMTPDVDETTESYAPLVSEPINGWVEGDGTSKTLTIYIANSGASDYFDDDVWVEVLNPTTDGTCGVERNSTLMNLLATPAAITDDGGSTWGTGANNHQKFVVSIAPDYEGPIQARVHFAKRFASSPETLYVDPKLHI